MCTVAMQGSAAKSCQPGLPLKPISTMGHKPSTMPQLTKMGCSISARLRRSQITTLVSASSPLIPQNRNHSSCHAPSPCLGASGDNHIQLKGSHDHYDREQNDDRHEANEQLHEQQLASDGTEGGYFGHDLSLESCASVAQTPVRRPIPRALTCQLSEDTLLEVPQ